MDELLETYTQDAKFVKESNCKLLLFVISPHNLNLDAASSHPIGLSTTFNMCQSKCNCKL